MNDDDMNNSILASPLATLRGELAKLDTPRCVEKELMQAFAKQFPPRRRWYQRLDTPQWGIAGSLASIALVVLVFAVAPRIEPHFAPGSGGAPLVQRSSDGQGVFIALDSLDRIEQEPAPRMVEAQVPRTALAPLGVAITPENAGDSVKAEMLVGANGHPLALRLTSLN
jgi:hypothetical protein